MSQCFVPVPIETADQLWEAGLLWYRWHFLGLTEPDAWSVDTSDGESAKPSVYGDYTPTATEDWIEYAFLVEE